MTYLTDDEVRVYLAEKKYDLVIYNYTNLCCSIADRIARKCWSHEWKDIRSVAMLALIEAVNNLKDHSNPRQFLRIRIKGAVLDFVMRDNTVYTPYNTEQMKKEMYVEDVQSETSLMQGVGVIPKEMWAKFDPTNKSTENLLFENKLLSDLEKKVLKLRIDGYNLDEISYRCKLSQTMVQGILTGTKSRVIKILNGDY